MNVLDLFSGIGGFSLGLERTGMRTVAFCEINPYCRAVLRKHWPDVPIFEDVRRLTATDVGSVDVICGGFPCQDISIAGKKAGIDGERSALWNEFARLIRELRPEFAIVENVARLTVSGLHRVLGDLTEIRYDAEWHCIPASSIGAPHIRDRVWIIAYPDSQRWGAGQHLMPDCCRFDHWQAAQGKSKWEDLERWIRASFQNGDWGDANAALLGMDDGLSDRLDRIRCCGNAVVPQIPEIIGRAIMHSSKLA